MTKLSDTQLVLLSHAAQQPDGNLLPLPTTITAPRPAIDKSIGSLLKRELIEEIEVTDETLAWRKNGETRYGVRISGAGRQAIAVTPDTRTDGSPVSPAQKKQSKAALIVELLQRDSGATLDELVAATGWLPHTTRAALTGLRKKGHVLDKSKREGVTCYSIAVVA
jgi:hypothetical protein